MEPSKHLEALTAVLLGDVGLMHDEIKALRNDSIPALVDGIKSALEKPGADMVEAADNLSNLARETLQAHLQASSAAKRELEAQAKASAANAQAAINTAVAGLIPAVQEAVADAARAKIGEIKYADNLWSIWYTGLLLGLVFFAGWAGGSMIFAKTQVGQLTWAEFWITTRWGIGIGFAAPTLILLGMGLSGSMPKTGWSLVGAGALTVLLLYWKLFTVL